MNRIVHIDKRQRSLTHASIVAKMFLDYLGHSNCTNLLKKPLVVLLEKLQQENANFELLLCTKLNIAKIYLQNNPNIENALWKCLQWVYYKDDDFVVRKCWMGHTARAWLQKHCSYVVASVLYFRLLVCQLLETHFSRSAQQIEDSVHIIFEYAAAHYTILRYTVEQDLSDDLLSCSHIAGRGLAMYTDILNFTDPTLHYDDSTSQIPDVTLLLTCHDRWWQCLHDSHFETSNGNGQTNAHAANAILTIIRKTQGQRCQVRGLTKTIQDLTSSNKITATCVSKWLCYSLFKKTTHCFSDAQTLKTQSTMNRILDNIHKENTTTFVREFFCQCNKSATTQAFLVCVMRDIVMQYRDIDILLSYKLNVHMQIGDNDIRISESLNTFRSILYQRMYEYSDRLLSTTTNTAIDITMSIINDCMTKTFLLPTYRLHSVVCRYKLYNWSWFEHCKDHLQKKIYPHKGILLIPFDSVPSAIQNMDASWFPRLKNIEAEILLRILAFHSKVYSIMRQTDFTIVSSILENLTRSFQVLHCSVRLQMAICSVVMQHNKAEVELGRVGLYQKEEWKAWIIFDVLDKCTSYQQFDLNGILCKAQLDTAKRLFPTNYQAKKNQKYQFCTSCPSSLSMKHHCTHSECLHSAVCGQINRTALNENGSLNKAVCMQTGKCVCVRWKKVFSANKGNLVDTAVPDSSSVCKYKVASMLPLLACMLQDLKVSTLLGKVVFVRSTAHMLCCGCLHPIMFVARPTLFGGLPVCKDCYAKMIMSKSYSNFKTCAYCMCSLACKSNKPKGTGDMPEFVAQWVMDDVGNNMKLRKLVFCRKHAPKHFMRNQRTRIGLLTQIYKTRGCNYKIKKNGRCTWAWPA